MTKQDLKKRAKDIVRMRKNRYKFKEIGQKWGISRQRAHKIWRGAVDKVVVDKKKQGVVGLKSNEKVYRM